MSDNCRDLFFTETTATALGTYSAYIGDGVNTAYNITHNLNSEEVTYSLRDVQTDVLGYAQVNVTGPNTVTISFDDPPALTAFYLTIFASVTAKQVTGFEDRITVNVTQPVQDISVNVADTSDVILVSPEQDVITISTSVQSVPGVTIDVGVVDTQEQVNVVVDESAGLWGTITGILSTQTDLWKYLSGVGTSNFDIATLNTYLSTNSILLCSLNVNGQILSAGVPLHNIFLTSETDSQTLSYTPSSYLLSISNGNTVNLSSINSLFGSVSGKYESVYSNVQSNSASWDSAYNIGTTYQSTSSIFAINSTVTGTYIQQDKIFLTQQLLKTFQKITLIDYPQTNASFTFLGVGDSMGWRKPTFAIMPYLWNRYGVGGAVFDGLVKRAFGNVTTTWAPNEANYSLWENGEVAYVGSGGSVWWGIQDGIPAGINAGYIFSNQITVYSVTSATGGTFKVQYSTDQSTWTDVTTLTSIDTTDPTGPKALISTGTAPSLGYYTWRVLGLTGTSIIISAKILNTSDPGAICGLIFRGGMTIASSNTVLSAIFNPIIADVAPDLVMWEQKDYPEDYVTGLPTYLNRWDSCFTAVSARPDWVLVGTNDTQANDTNTEQIRQTTKQVADSRKLAYFDFNGAIGGWEGIQRMRWDWDTTGAYDPVHLNDNAQRVGGQIFLRSAGLFTTPYKSDISQNVNDGGTLIYSLNSNQLVSTPLNVGLQVNGTPGGVTSLRLGSRNSIGMWGIYKLPPTDGQAPYGFNIAGGLNNDGRIRLDSDGRTAIRQTGVGDTWPRTERLWVGEAVPTYSVLTINHNNYGTDNQMTGKLLKATYKGNEVASIDYRGIVYALSGDSTQWNSVFTTVRNNSASWEESADILPTVTNYLSTNNVLVSGLSVTGNISAAGSVISRIPLVFTTLSAYTLSLADQSDLITINNSLTSFVYIPNDSLVNFGDGSQINISRLGSGTVTISALDGVVLRSADNRNQLRTQNSTATIVKLSANDWLLFGDIS